MLSGWVATVLRGVEQCIDSAVEAGAGVQGPHAGQVREVGVFLS